MVPPSNEVDRARAALLWSGRPVGANGARSSRPQLLTESAHRKPDTNSDAEPRRVHGKVDPPRMSTWHPYLKGFKYRREADASQWNKHISGAIPDRDQKARESERPQVLQIVRNQSFRANGGWAKGQTDERASVEPRSRAGP